MKNSSDYGNGPPGENEKRFEQPPTPTGYPDSSTFHNNQFSSDYQQTQNNSQSPKHYPQHFYQEGFQNGNNSQYSFVMYNQENNINKLNVNSSFRHHPYDRPNSRQSQSSNSMYLQNLTPSPSPKQCEKCGLICESINQLTEHVDSCHPSTPMNFQNYNMLSGGEIVKNKGQSEILDLDSYKVHQVVPKEESIYESNNGMGQWNQPVENQNIQMGLFSPSAQRIYMQQEMNVRDQRMFSPNYQNFSSTQEVQQSFPQPSFEMEQKQGVVNESPSPAKSSTWKSNEARKPKTYNCTACNKWFTSSGHLKRHYNTTLHKNAVKTTGEPDPANFPISVHHRPKGNNQNRPGEKQIQHSPVEEIDRPRSSNGEQDNMVNMDPPNAQADPSVTVSRGLQSISNNLPINPTNNTFNSINNGFIHPMLMPMDYQMYPNGNAPHDSPVIILNDPAIIGSDDVEYSPHADHSQPLPSFSQIQRYGQMQYYGDVGGEAIAYSSYNLTQFNPPQTSSYNNQNEDQNYTLIAPPDSTSTDGDLLPITSSVNNNNLIVGNEEPLVPDIKYDIHCSSPEISNPPQDIENSSPRISSTSNIMKPLPLHKCFDCDKVFNKSCYLTQHNKTFHCGDKPFKCTRCGKRFSSEKLHSEHQAKHGGDKPHKCDQCPKQFNHKTDLRRHMCLHTGTKPFICDLCGKGFIRKDHMVKHGETHLKKKTVQG